ncbi:AAA family ATPase [Yersinia enterocolitica]|nr:AAA family ATPase [Yersinia enterocolitica]EKN4116023.1 AAA family ATPase [Yersinia enterocolitica]
MLIFVAGVHGVGKGYLCEKYSIYNNAIHKSASQLIKEYGGLELPDDKLTSNVDRNQVILIAALDVLRENKETILLDGHFALVSKSGVIKKIDLDVFKALRLDGVILIKNDSEVITQRILKRDGNNPVYNVEELISMEEENTHTVCEKLKIPLKELIAPTLDDFIKAVKEIGREI